MKEFKETTVFIILDAFRWDYLSEKDTPTLYKMAHDGIYAKKIVSSTGFTQRAAIFTGTYPDTNGYYTMYSYDPTKSPYKILEYFQPLLKIVEKSLFLERVVRFLIYKYGRVSYSIRKGQLINPGAIPFEIIPKIATTEDEKTIYAPNSLSVESIFDIFARKNINSEYLMYPAVDGDDAYVERYTLEKLHTSSNKDIMFLQFSESDFGCHEHGSEGEKRRSICNKIDQRIARLQTEFNEKYEKVNFIIIGDHGMRDIEEKIDIKKIVSEAADKNSLTRGRDFLMFLDSTLARFWFFNEKAEEIVTKTIKKLSKYGKIIDAETCKKYRIPCKDKRYGDLIFWTAPGVLISPDYFHSAQQKVKAMHGYDSYDEKMQGFAIVHGTDYKPKQIACARLIDLCPTICDILKIEPPKTNEGTSLLKYKKNE